MKRCQFDVAELVRQDLLLQLLSVERQWKVHLEFQSHLLKIAAENDVLNRGSLGVILLEHLRDKIL